MVQKPFGTVSEKGATVLLPMSLPNTDDFDR